MESVTIGPFVVSTQLAIPVVSIAAAIIVVRFLGPGSTAARRSAADAIFSLATAFAVPWKLAPVITQTDAVLRDPRILLVAPGGRVGTLLGLIGVAVMLWLMWRRAGYPKDILVDASRYPVVAISALTGAIALVTAVLLSGALLLVSVDPDSDAPDFTLESLSGEIVTVDEVRSRGSDVVVVNFWATWCVPCRAEMAVKDSLYAEFGDSVEILAVNLTSTESGRIDVARFADEWRVSYPVLLDVDGSAAASYSVRGTPTTVFVDADGTAFERVFGPMTMARARRILSAHIETE